MANGIAWSDSFRLGNEQVDGQHQRLFVLLSELVDACADGTDTGKLQETLDFLVNYTVQHFNDEEALQRLYNYPDFAKHKQIHEDFKVTVGELVGRFKESGSSKELSADVNKIIVRWLLNHVQREDKKIGEYLRTL